MSSLNPSFLSSGSLSRYFNIIREDSTRYNDHGLFSYPAMMVPRLQGELIDALLSELGAGEKTIFDPFMGSGTVLSESVLRGVNFYGSDINPLSLLCCRVKSDFFDSEMAMQQLGFIKNELVDSYNEAGLIEFGGSDKWFDEDTLRTLVKVRDVIARVELKWCRRIFWLALAESVRKFSKTRMSTYKLHVDKEFRPASHESVVNHFLAICERNLSIKEGSWNEMKSRGGVVNGEIVSNVSLELSDIRCLGATFEADLIVTSPPYGDNKTTVTYGQFSYLPLQFINLDDIDHSFDRPLTESISAIDSASLGGSLRSWKEKMEVVQVLSSSLQTAFSELIGVGRGGEKRLAAFSYDLWESLISIAQRLKRGGFIMMTLGNRTINGVSIPLDEIVEQFLLSLGLEMASRLNRDIKKKRMAGSMSSEIILIMKKSG